jgi:hypothetical protein
VSKLEPHLERPLTAYRANPHPASADAFLAAARPIVDAGVTTYGGGDANPMLASRARRIVLDSARSYDAARGASFKTHAMNQLRGLQRYGARQRQVLSVPEAVALDQGHLRAATEELRDRLGREPSDQEIGDHTGLSSRRRRYVAAYRPGLAEGQVASAGDEEGDDAYEPAVDRPGDPRLLAEFLYPDLDPIDQVILEHSMGLRGRMPIPGHVLARKVGLSPGAVSQRKARLDARLRRLTEAELF